MNTSWVPSHVQVTIHQARELLLKSKNGHSEVYVSLQAERNKFITSAVPRQTTPEWKDTTDIPLMTLDTTLHLSVRQKGRIGDDFLGYVGIPLGGFRVTSKPVTHWYKLGAKPGKANTKLRGDLLVTVRFVSKWMSVDSDSKAVMNGDAKPKRVLKRSKSELKVKPNDPTKVSDKQKLGIFRRSLRKNKKAPAFEECVDDFAQFSHSPTHNSEHRSRAQTLDLRVHTTSSGGSKSQSDSENSDSSPVPTRPSVEALFAEAAAIENEELPSSHIPDSLSGSEKQITPAMKYHNFRRKKRPWSMYLVPTTPTPTRIDTPTLGSFAEENTAALPNSTSSSEQMESSSDAHVIHNGSSITYRAKSSSLAKSPRARPRPRSCSVSVTDSQQSLRSLDHDSTSESCSESTSSPQLGVIYRRREDTTTSQVSQRRERTRCASYSEFGTRSKNVREMVNHEGQASQSVSGRRSGSPLSASKQVVTPRLLSFNDVASDSKLRRRTSSPLFSKSLQGSGRWPAALPSPARIPSPKSLPLRSSPILIGPPLTEEDSESSETVENEKQMASKTETDGTASTRTESSDGNGKAMNSSAAESSYKSREEKPSSAMVEETRGLEESGSSTDGEVSPLLPTEKHSFEIKPDISQYQEVSDQKRTAPVTMSDSNLDSETPYRLNSSQAKLELPKNATLPKKTRHTVMYKEHSPILKKAFQPVSVLPPSFTDYKSQTLPSRGRALKTLSYTDRSSSGSLRVEEQGSRTKPDRSPENIRPFDRKKFNFVPSPARPSTPVQQVSSKKSGAGTNGTESPGDTNRSSSGSLRVEEQSGRTKPDRSPENIRPFDRKRFNFVPSPARPSTPVQQVPSKKSGAGTNGTESPGDTPSRSATPVTPSTPVTSVPPSTPSSLPKQLPKSLTEDPFSCWKNHRPTGGLRRAMSMYQENRRQSAKTKKSMDGKKSVDISLSQILLPPDQKERMAVSADNSPELSRRHSQITHSSRFWTNPFSNLRRTRSYYLTSTTEDASSNDLIANVIQSSLEGRSAVPAAPTRDTSKGEGGSPDLAQVPSQSTPALCPPTKTSGSSEQSSARSSPYSSPLPIIPPKADSQASSVLAPQEPSVLNQQSNLRKPSGKSFDSDSVKTLTESETGSNQQHTTSAAKLCSSAESEGLGSMTSEELTLEDLAHQDWSQWSKEDLVKELIHSKQRLCSVEDDLKAVQSYLDNLLLRIMETNPALLSSSQ